MGESQVVSFTLAPKQFSVVLEDGSRVVQAGEFELFVGGGQPGTGAADLMAKFTIL